MKKTAICTTLFVLLTAALFATDTKGVDNSVVYRKLQVYKVYEHSDAYVVMYYTDGIELGQVTLPTEWFKSGQGKGVLNMLPKNFAPYLVLQYTDGTFTRAVLNMPKNKGSSVWQHLKPTVDVSASKQKDTLTLE